MFCSGEGYLAERVNTALRVLEADGANRAFGQLRQVYAVPAR